MNSQTTDTFKIDPASFRDSSGFIFELDKCIYRAIAPSYFDNFSFLENSGLYKHLLKKKLLIPHARIDSSAVLPKKYEGYRVIQPENIPFISYPYEWCFSQLKEAALLTLKIQKEALNFNMSLKDASAYNIQFLGAHPYFIDTLSFEKHTEGNPWVAYSQFCQHFLAPLALICYKHEALSRLSQLFIDGIPIELANSLLPKRSLANFTIFSHIHLHSKFQSKYSSNKKEVRIVSISKRKLFTLLEHIEDGIKGFSFAKKTSNWNNYFETHNYTEKGKEKKKKIVTGWIQKLKPQFTFDLGCNTGEHSILASQYSAQVVAMDSDTYCIEKLYTHLSKGTTTNILPLVVDLTNPSPSIGWHNSERKTINKRKSADLLLALALVHHLRIGNNTPWKYIFKLFSEWGDHAIVEYIPREDSQVQLILKNKKNIFYDLDIDSFNQGINKYFEIQEIQDIPDSLRKLYFLKKKLN